MFWGIIMIEQAEGESPLLSLPALPIMQILQNLDIRQLHRILFVCKRLSVAACSIVDATHFICVACGQKLARYPSASTCNLHHQDSHAFCVNFKHFSGTAYSEEYSSLVPTLRTWIKERYQVLEAHDPSSCIVRVQNAECMTCGRQIGLRLCSIKVAIPESDIRDPNDDSIARWTCVNFAEQDKLLQVWQAAGLACVRSGMCSLGKTTPFVGEIWSSQGLRKAAEARSWNKEIIIMITDSKRLLPMASAIGSLQRLGIEHVLMISDSEESCQLIAGNLPTIGCSWSTFQLPMKGEHIGAVVPVAPLWHTRWRTIARLVRMRYNVLCLDSDVIIWDDPYKFLKSPPFKDFVILDQPEVLYHQEEYQDNVNVNGGIIYIQNASPQGPAAWLMAEVSDRLLRWIDDDFKVLKSNGMETWCCYIDQDCLRDSLSAVQAGRPLWHASWYGCVPEHVKQEMGQKHQRIDQAHIEKLKEVWQMGKFGVPTWMSRYARSSEVTMKWFNMSLPTSQGVWPEDLGGNLYPATRGPLSKEFIQQLKTDTTEALWPDPEDASPAAVQRSLATPKERWGFLPLFMIQNYFSRGRLGYWNPSLTGGDLPTPQIIGHTQWIPDTDSSISKNVVAMLSGHYDWALAHEWEGQAVFFANKKHDGDMDQQALSKMPKFLALHPRVRLGLTRNWEEYQVILLGLAQAAHLMGRAVLWPDLPCNTTWIVDSRGGTHQLPLDIRSEWMPWGNTLQDLKCTCLYQLKEACLMDHRGMVSLEWQHYRQLYSLRQALEPSAANTILLTGRNKAQVAHRTLHSAFNSVRSFSNRQKHRISPSDRILVVPEQQVAQLASKYEDDPVLYLANPVQIKYSNDDSPALLSFRQKWGRCPVLSRAAWLRVNKNDAARLTSTARFTFRYADVVDYRTRLGVNATDFAPLQLNDTV